jgi:glycosidase
VITILLFQACQPGQVQSTEGQVDGHPGWLPQGNVYEVNIRQYTPEGTFRAFEKHLDRLRAMGVECLWFMPIHPISKVDRKGELGSYYAASDFYGINPEFGTLDDWKALVKSAQSKGFKVLMDCIPNHTGADHYWVKDHPEFYIQDSLTGKPLSPFDWSDVRELNYDNQTLRDSMINMLKYWIRETGIDGYRVDVAWGVPDDFWKNCISELRKLKPGLMMLAEAEGPNFHADGFDATYPWSIFHTLNDIAAGKKTVLALDSVLRVQDSLYPANAIRLYFTSNHDENSWNKADYGTMPGALHAPFAVFTQTYARSVPLIYSGQEEPFLDSIRFFYKDTIHFSQYQRASFYKTLLELRKINAALSASVPAQKINVGNAQHVFAFSRAVKDNKVLVILNLSATPEKVTIGQEEFWGQAHNAFSGQQETITGSPFTLAPWGYAVYVYP